MRAVRIAVAVLVVAGMSSAVAAQEAPGGRAPDVAYLYPAGGRAGTTVRVEAGGQNLADVTGVHVVGDGVRAVVLRHVPALDRRQRAELRRRMAVLLRRRRQPDRDRVGTEDGGDGALSLPEGVRPHPWLEDVIGLPTPALEEMASRLLHPRHLVQENRQLAETVELLVEIDPGAEAGERELRLETRSGITAPVRFRVGDLPEVRDRDVAAGGVRTAAVLDVPVLVNGQVLAGDVDRFRIRARRGRRLVIEVAARRLRPYLADAVPGWFQAVVEVRDAAGREVAFADDWRFDPDPVLAFEVPEDGEYEVAIRDAIHRGREDFVYRVAISERPFPTAVFPAGGRAGSVVMAMVTGWNLPFGVLRLDTGDGGEGAGGEARTPDGDRVVLPYPVAVDRLAEDLEVEDNDTPSAAQRIAPPCIVNGRIDRPGDVDVFGFTARAGEEVVVEVRARRLGSPLDSVVYLEDAAGNVIAWNDDAPEWPTGLSTHRADSLLRARLPHAGPWLLRVADVRRLGGEAFVYRLRVGPPRPDFTVYLVPSSLELRAGSSVPVRAHVRRAEGFEGPVAVEVVGGPRGLVLGGATIPAGRDAIAMTLTAPREPVDGPFTLAFRATARIGGRTVGHAVIPAEDRMQAFLYRHLVPSLATVARIRGAGRAPPPAELAGRVPVRLRPGGTTLVHVRTPRRSVPDGIELALQDPPPGVTLGTWRATPAGLEFELRCAEDIAGDVPPDNLIVAAWVQRRVRTGRDSTVARGARVFAGWLPAIPVVVDGARRP